MFPSSPPSPPVSFRSPRPASSRSFRCTSPISTMAAGQGDPQRAAILLTVYSAGLAVPFFLAALFGTSAGVIRRLAPRLQALSTVAGSVMLAAGAIMILGIYEQIFVKLASVV